MTDLKILATHPVQYQVPLFRELAAAGLQIEVGYYHQGAAGRPSHDADFGLDFEWDVDLLSGYPYKIFWSGVPAYTYAEQSKVARRLLPWVLGQRKTPLLLIGWGLEMFWLSWLMRVLGAAPTLVIGENTSLSFAAAPKPRWRVSLLRLLLQHTAAALYVGTNNLKFLLDMGVKKDCFYYAPYSIDNASFKAGVKRLLPHRDELCHQNGLDPELPVFLFCGKLIVKKRPLELLEAFLAAGLQNRAQLLYVGDGVLRPLLERRVQAAGAGTNVHFLGFLNQSQMPLAYVLGEILCLISDPAETWGLVVNEAMACGRPVMVTNTVGCAPDLVTRDNGWVVPLDDQEALTGALRQALGRRNLWAEMGNKGQEIIAGHTFSAMAAGVQEALEHISRSHDQSLGGG